MEIYLIQFIFGIGHGLSYPGWMTIFSKFIEKGKEGFEWSVRSTFIGIGAAGAGALGGIIATRFGFTTLFIGVGVFVLISAFLPFLIYREFSPRNHKFPRAPQAKSAQEPHLPKG